MTELEPERSSRGAWLAVLGLGTAAAVVFAWLTRGVAGPLVFYDELIYMEGGTSLARDGVLAFREGAFGYGPVYPSIIAAVLLMVEDRVAAYHVLLGLNAALLGSAAIPLFLIARRLAPPRVSVLAVAVCLLLPNSFYAAYLMTDVLGYVVALWAIVGLLRVLERPSLGRQAVALAGCGLAAAVRPQFVSLLAAYAIAVMLSAAARRQTPRAVARSYAPTLLLAGVVLGAMACLAVIGRASGLLGAYEVLWRGYDPFLALRWVVYHALDAALYVWLVPAMLVPAVLVALWRRARDNVRAASVLGVTVGVSTAALLLAGLFGATEYAGARLHDRYLFALFPLWTILVVDWAARSARADRRTRALGVAVVVVLALAVPFRGVIDVARPNLFDAVATSSWSLIADLVGRDGVLSVRALFLAAVCIAGLVVVLSGARGTRYALIVCAGLLLITAGGQWAGALAASERGTFSDDRPGTLQWIDRAVAATGSPVTFLFVGTPRCDERLLRALYVSEFFNARVGEVVSIAEDGDDEPSADHGRLGPGGVVLRSSGRPLVAPFVLAAPGLELDGRVVAVGTTSGLRVWRTGGPVRLVAPAGRRDVLARSCFDPYPPSS